MRYSGFLSLRTSDMGGLHLLILHFLHVFNLGRTCAGIGKVEEKSSQKPKN